jgi:hypothetical protein
LKTHRSRQALFAVDFPYFISCSINRTQSVLSRVW